MLASEAVTPEHLTLLPPAFYSEQGGKTYVELGLMLCDEILKGQIIASWGICCGLPLDGLFVLCWKRVRNKGKGLDRREKSQWDTRLVAVPMLNLLEWPPGVRKELS